jgi:hypothetical protein
MEMICSMNFSRKTLHLLTAKLFHATGVLLIEISVMFFEKNWGKTVKKDFFEQITVWVHPMYRTKDFAVRLGLA